MTAVKRHKTQSRTRTHGSRARARAAARTAEHVAQMKERLEYVFIPRALLLSLFVLGLFHRKVLTAKGARGRIRQSLRA